MAYSVRFTDTATQDLREITFWIARHSADIKLASKFVKELRIKCENLAEFPNMGAYPRDYVLKSMEYRFLVHGNYLIFYRIDESNEIVNIEAIFNSKKDYIRTMSRIAALNTLKSFREKDDDFNPSKEYEEYMDERYGEDIIPK